MIGQLSRSLRWYYPDQVLRVKQVFFQPTSVGTPGESK